VPPFVIAPRSGAHQSVCQQQKAQAGRQAKGRPKAGIIVTLYVPGTSNTCSPLFASVDAIDHQVVVTCDSRRFDLATATAMEFASLVLMNCCEEEGLLAIVPSIPDHIGVVIDINARPHVLLEFDILQQLQYVQIDTSSSVRAMAHGSDSAKQLWGRRTRCGDPWLSGARSMPQPCHESAYCAGRLETCRNSQCLNRTKHQRECPWISAWAYGRIVSPLVHH
jgi:hypothetical protein